jgi:hypothetical protein
MRNALAKIVVAKRATEGEAMTASRLYDSAAAGEPGLSLPWRTTRDLGRHLSFTRGFEFSMS